MKATIRNRAAALAVAAVAGIAGIGLASGPALAAPAPAAARSAATTTNVEPQSVHYPIDTGIYADELVRAWGAGNTDRVKGFATPQVVKALNKHGNEHGTHWIKTGVEGAAGTVYSDFRNTVTGETMSVGVANEQVSEGGEWGSPHGVHSVQFGD